MKKKLKKFNRYCGMAKIEKDSEELFVIYADLWPHLPSESYGDVIGTGKNENEAMQNAIENMINRFVEVDKIIGKSIKKINELELTFGHGIFSEEEIIYPIETTSVIYDDEQNIHREIPNGKFANAAVYCDKNGPFLG